MLPTLLDKLFVICVVAGLVLWSGAMSIIWADVFDSSGLSWLIALSAMVLSVAAGAMLVRAVARITRGTLVRLGFFDPAVSAIVSVQRFIGPGGDYSDSHRQAIAAARMLGVAGIFASVLTMANTFVPPMARPFVEFLAGRFVWAPLSWAVVKFAVILVLMLPFGVGMSVMFLLSVVARSRAAVDAYDDLWREFIWGAAMGSALFALVWLVGGNLYAIAVTSLIPLIGIGFGMFLRRNVRPRPRRAPRSSFGAERRLLCLIVADYAVAAVIIMFQLRLLADAAGVGLAGKALWAALTLSLLAGFLQRFDAKSHSPGRAQSLGAIAGICVIGIVQAALGIIAITGNASAGPVWAAGLCAAFAVILQIPMAALGSVLISRHRRIFADAGWRAAAYLKFAVLGAVVGIIIYMAIFTLPGGGYLLPGGVMILCAIAVAGQILGCSRREDQLKWVGWGALLICNLTVLLLIAVGIARGAVGRVRAGVWISAVSEASHGCVGPRILPAHSRPWHRSEEITRIISDTMDMYPGRWWVVSGDDEDLPREAPRGVHVTLSAPDPTALPPGLWGGLVVPGSEGDYLQAAQTNTAMFDGILLAAMPAEHPMLWRCYNTRVLRRCFARTHRNAPVLLRIQAADEGTTWLLSVAETFRRTIGPAWAVVSVRHDMADVLLIGPADIVKISATEPEVAVVPVKKLWRDWERVSPVQLVRPRRRLWADRPSPTRLDYWVGLVEQRSDD